MGVMRQVTESPQLVTRIVTRVNGATAPRPSGPAVAVQFAGASDALDLQQRRAGVSAEAGGDRDARAPLDPAELDDAAGRVGDQRPRDSKRGINAAWTPHMKPQR